MQNTVIDCAEICKDPIVKEKLTKVQQKAEDIYTGEEYDYRDLTADELIIVLLLSFIREKEALKGLSLIDSDTINDCISWNMALQNVKFKLTDEIIQEKTDKIKHSINEETASE